jgi:hypothetical protein
MSDRDAREAIASGHGRRDSKVEEFTASRAASVGGRHHSSSQQQQTNTRVEKENRSFREDPWSRLS